MADNNHLDFGVDLLPATDLEYNLGSANKKWNIFGNINSESITISGTAASTSTSTGAIVVSGGVGAGGRITALEFNATRPMVVSAGKVYSNISGSNVLQVAKTTSLYSNGLAIAHPSLTAANDVGWLRVTGTSESDMALEIATGDDGGTSTGERIVVRLYNTSNTIVKEAVLLEKLTGATTFPVSVSCPSFIGDLTGNANTTSLLKPISDTTTASASTWNIPSGSYQVWGERFSDTRLKYTPEGGSETTITDTGDWTIWLTPTVSGAATLNMRIDGTYYGSFSGNLNGNASTASTATTADKLTGFSSRATTMTWGNLTGTVITCFATSGGGGWGFRDNNPASGQTSMTIDGTIYIKEGAVNIADAVKSFTASGQTITYTNLWGGTGTFTTQDTKNTAGSSATSTKIFLVGATALSTSAQTYSNTAVFATDGVLSAKSIGINDSTTANKVTLQWNSTDSALEFVFA